jgi:hypothetical protein
MGVDYNVKLAFGYSEDQLKGRSSLWAIKSFWENGDDWEDCVENVEVNPEPTEEQMKLLEKSGVTIVSYGSTMGGDSDEVLTLDEASYSVSIFDKEIINPKKLVVKPEWLEKLKFVTNLLGIEVEGDPQWYLGGVQW